MPEKMIGFGMRAAAYFQGDLWAVLARTPCMTRPRSVFAKLCPLALAVLFACAPAVEDAAGKGLGITAASRGVELPGSPYRYVTLNSGLDVRMPTIVLRIDREKGRVDRWWRLRGRYYLPAAAYDLGGAGISRDGRTLVLQRFTKAYPPRRSRFAVLDTDVHLSHPLPPGQERPRHAVRRIEIPGFYSLHAISPDGTTAYLTRHLIRGRSIARFELRALDLGTGQLLPGAVESLGQMEGLPITQAISRDRRRVYTLYDGNTVYGDSDGVPFLLALDTEEMRMQRIELPQLRDRRTLFLTKLRFAAGGSRLVVFRRSPSQARPPTPPLLAIDTETLAVSDVGTAMAALGRRLMTAFAAALPAGDGSFLSFARTPRQPGNLLSRHKTVGHSSEGRPIGMWQVGDPRWSGELLVFGCVHGDECGARGIQPTTGGCPDPSADIYVVPSLNPDGERAGSRLNGRGVDLNRNFSSEWSPRESRGDPQYSGPKPFSEPETRLAARIIRNLRPEATIWFHQHWGSRPFVRAWGPSAPDARRFAGLARLPFRLMRWPAGTAPNWQNHELRGDSSFVVELPRGALDPAMETRLSRALVWMGRWVRED
jgi:murein peptide amidase A